jgi:integrase
MTNSLSVTQHAPRVGWKMPIVPDDYDRSPLTPGEYEAIAWWSVPVHRRDRHSNQTLIVKDLLARLDQPLVDIYRLRHREHSTEGARALRNFFRQEMYRRGKIYWDWSEEEWVATVGPTSEACKATYGKTIGHYRASIIDAAYLLGGVTDLRSVGIGWQITDAARTYFGTEFTRQRERVLSVLVRKGFTDGRSSVWQLDHGLSMLFVLNRSPFLEDLSEELFASVQPESEYMQPVYQRIVMCLQHLGLFPPLPGEMLTVPRLLQDEGMAHEWYEWCLAWYKQNVDLTPRIRRHYMNHLLMIGRWLSKHAPEVTTPEQWTEDLALRFKADLCTWKMGEYASEKGRSLLEAKGQLGMPLGPEGIHNYLNSLRRYLIDLCKRPHVAASGQARRIQLDFSPQEALATPRPIRQALDRASPRDVDLRVWAKLAIAAATLAQSDLPPGAMYPLNFYRALSLIWVTSARRPNEIARLRLDCVRRDWDAEMFDEDHHPVERLVASETTGQGKQEESGKKNSTICYLQIPSGKNRGPFWIWVPGYVADAIETWKRERPSAQKRLLDQKDREEVEYLFCFRDVRVGSTFINSSLIPALCAKAGVNIEDAKGRITGHRGRSTRLTLLRKNGVGLDDLAEYAGHANTRTIRRYANQDPIQLHRIIKDADDLSRIIEGVVDVQAAAQGLPALRWFIGYDTDGEPMYCGNQVYHTCPHRLDCVKCGMFIGGEKAKLLHEGEATLPVTSKVPMTPIEKCVVDGDEPGAAVCRTALQQEAAPETPDIHLIFNPEGLSNHELEELAENASASALDKLRQALAAHEKQLAEVVPHKTGRNALVGAQRKRIKFIQGLINDCEQRSRNGPGLQA